MVQLGVGINEVEQGNLMARFLRSFVASTPVPSARDRHPICVLDRKKAPGPPAIQMESGLRNLATECDHREHDRGRQIGDSTAR